MAQGRRHPGRSDRLQDPGSRAKAHGGRGQADPVQLHRVRPQEGRPPDVVEIASEWYVEMAEAAQAKQSELDKIASEDAEDTLRKDWAHGEFKANTTIAHRFIEGIPGVGVKFAEARIDGKRLAICPSSSHGPPTWAARSSAMSPSPPATASASTPRARTRSKKSSAPMLITRRVSTRNTRDPRKGTEAQEIGIPDARQRMDGSLRRAFYCPIGHPCKGPETANLPAHDVKPRKQPATPRKRPRNAPGHPARLRLQNPSTL
jgi:hypothetical protein